jgi:type II secretory pathway component PulF
VLRDFGVRLNPFTRALAAFAGSRAWIALGAVTALAAAILALRAVLGPAMIDRIVAAVPLIGPLWRWTALTEFSGLMALLLERELPLPHALEMTSAGLTDRGLAAGCQAALEKVQQGRSLADAVCETPQFSSSLPPLLRWGELRGALPDALQAAVEMYTGRADAQADLVRTVVPPLVFLMVLAGALLILTATYAPLIQVINLLVSL